MRWFDRSDKTQRIGTLEVAIAKLAGEMMQIKEAVKAQTKIAEKTQAGVEDIKETMAANHIECTRCEGVQDGRWKEHLAEHKAILANMEEMAQALQRLTDDVRVLSSSVRHIAEVQDRMRDR